MDYEQFRRLLWEAAAQAFLYANVYEREPKPKFHGPAAPVYWIDETTRVTTLEIVAARHATEPNTGPVRTPSLFQMPDGWTRAGYIKMDNLDKETRNEQENCTARCWPFTDAFGHHRLHV